MSDKEKNNGSAKSKAFEAFMQSITSGMPDDLIDRLKKLTETVNAEAEKADYCSCAICNIRRSIQKQTKEAGIDAEASLLGQVGLGEPDATQATDTPDKPDMKEGEMYSICTMNFSGERATVGYSEATESYEAAVCLRLREEDEITQIGISQAKMLISALKGAIKAADMSNREVHGDVSKKASW